MSAFLKIKKSHNRSNLMQLASTQARRKAAEALACNVAGALKSLDELSEERGNLEKAFRWEWDNDDVLKGRTPPGVNPNQMFRDGLKRYAQLSLLRSSAMGCSIDAHAVHKHVAYLLLHDVTAVLLALQRCCLSHSQNIFWHGFETLYTVFRSF